MTHDRTGLGIRGGWPLTRLEQKGPVHIMGHAKETRVLGSKALKVLRACICVCVRAHILPPRAQIYAGLQPVNLGELLHSLRV